MSRTYSLSTCFEQALQEARRTRKWKGLWRLVNQCQDRMAQAELVGWPALVESWKRDLERVQALQKQLRAGK